MPCRITLHQGDTLRRRFRATDRTTGDVVNLAGFEVEFEVKTADDEPDPPLVARQVGNGVTILDQTPGSDTEGVVEVQLDPIHTRDLDPDTYRYDVVWIEADLDRFHFPGTPEDFVVLGVVNQADGAGPPPVVGQPAPQSEQERSFTHTWSTTGQTDLVTFAAGMFDAGYVVAARIRSVPAGGPVVAQLLSLSETVGDFVLDAGDDGFLLAGTTIDVIVRDS